MHARHTAVYVTAAVDEAERFLARAAEWLGELRDAEEWTPYRSPKRAAAMRASMDLTRELAKLRRLPVYKPHPTEGAER